MNLEMVGERVCFPPIKFRWPLLSRPGLTVQSPVFVFSADLCYVSLFVKFIC